MDDEGIETGADDEDDDDDGEAEDAAAEDVTFSFKRTGRFGGSVSFGSFGGSDI